MTDYLVIPFSDRIRKVTASSAHTARNKYTKEMGEETYVIVVPVSHGFKGRGTIGAELEALWKCTIETLDKIKKAMNA